MARHQWFWRQIGTVIYFWMSIFIAESIFENVHVNHIHSPSKCLAWVKKCHHIWLDQKEKGHLFSVRGFETSKFALNGCLRVSKNPKFHAWSKKNQIDSQLTVKKLKFSLIWDPWIAIWFKIGGLKTFLTCYQINFDMFSWKIFYKNWRKKFKTADSQ